MVQETLKGHSTSPVVAVAKHEAYPLCVGEVMGSILGPNCSITKDAIGCTYCWYVWCATLIVMGECHGPKSG